MEPQRFGEEEQRGLDLGRVPGSAGEGQVTWERGRSEKRTPAKPQRVGNAPLPLNEDDGEMNVFVKGEAQPGLCFGDLVQWT